MRASKITVCLAVLLTASPALAKGHKAKPKAAEEEPAAEPASDGETGWDQSAESIGKKKPQAQSASADSASDAASDSRDSDGSEHSASSDNVAAIDAASDTTAKDEAVATKAPPSWWFGAYLNGTVVPSFMLSLFLQDPPGVFKPAFGLTATHRNKDGFSFVLGLGYASYGFDGPFHQKGKPDEDTEWVKSNLALVHLRAQMLWSSEIVPEKLSFEYGIGLDFGVILGNLNRTEAYPKPGGGYAPCVGVGIPNPVYCEPTQNGTASDPASADGAQYNQNQSLPPVMVLPMLPVLALRYTPIRNLAVKLEGSYGILQFAFGVSAAYGVDM